MLTRTDDNTMTGLEDECVRHLQALIRLDTSNPP